MAAQCTSNATIMTTEKTSAASVSNRHVLGAAILGCPSASLLLPDSWRTSLLHNYLDDKSRLAVFRTCRSGRDWVWQGSESATLTCSLDGAMETVFSTVCAATAWLHSRRQGSSTQLTLRQTQPDRGNVFVALGVLHGMQPHLTQLCLELLQHYTHDQASTILGAITTSCPHLQTLKLPLMRGALPPPSTLPHLTQLHINDPRDEQGPPYHHAPQEPPPPATCTSVAPYLPQLVSLKLYMRRWQPHQVLSEAPPSSSLRHLHLSGALDDQLLDRIMRHTPNVTDLTCGQVQLTSAQHAQSTWQVKRLRLDSVFRGLELLPEPADGLLTLTFYEDLFIDLLVEPEGLCPVTARRLREWQYINLDILNISPADPNIPPTALATAIHQLAAAPASMQCTLCLCGHWQWSPALATELNTALNTHPQLKALLDTQELTDTLATTLVTHCPRLQLFQFGRLALQTDLSALTCAWSEATVYEELPAQVLLRLPQPESGMLQLHKGGIYVDDCLTVTLTQEEVEAGVVVRLTQRLQHITCSPPHYTRAFAVSVQCPPDTDPTQQPALLREHLAVLVSMRVDSGVPILQLLGWHYTVEVLAELRGLPQWSRKLRLQGVWPEARPTYCQLGRLVPVSYRRLCLQGADQSQCLDVLVGMSRNEERLSGLSCTVYVDSEGIAEYVRSYTQQLKRLEGVELRHEEDSWADSNSEE